MNRHLAPAELLGGRQTAQDNYTFRVDNDRLAEAKLPKRGSHFVDGLRRDFASGPVCMPVFLPMTRRLW